VRPKQSDKPKLRDDLTPAEGKRAEKIGRIEFKSAGATRKASKERP
jgi:hypothetical protein